MQWTISLKSSRKKSGEKSATPTTRTPTWDTHSLTTTPSHQRWHPRPNIRRKKLERGK